MGSPSELDLGQVTDRLGCRYLVTTSLPADEAVAIGRRNLFIKIYALEQGAAAHAPPQPDDPAISRLAAGPGTGLASCGALLAPDVPALWWIGGMPDTDHVAQAARAIASARNIAADLIVIDLGAVLAATIAPAATAALTEILGATHVLSDPSAATGGRIVALPRSTPGPIARDAVACRWAVARGDLDAARRTVAGMAEGPAGAWRTGGLRGLIALRALSSLLAGMDQEAETLGDLLVRMHRDPANDPRVAASLGDARRAPGRWLLLALHLAHVDGAAAAIAALPQAVADGSGQAGAPPAAVWAGFATALPEDPRLRVAIANGLSARGWRDAAAHLLDLVLTAPESGAGPLFDAGKALDALDQPARAAAAYRRVLALEPDHAAAHNNLAMILFLDGAFAAAWAHHEWRFAAKGLTRAPLPGAELTTADVTGQTILVRGEQGIGDHLQFARYARALHERGNRVVFAVRDEMLAFLRAQDFVAAAYGNGDCLPAYDAHVDLLSLGRLFGAPVDPVTTSATPYLRADPARVEVWRRRLAHLPSPRVAIAWAGNPRHYNDRNRSIPASSLFAALGTLPVRCVSLQKGLPAGFGFPAHVLDIAGDLHDLMDAAAAVQCVDLVISVDTAMAHLAGGLGRPVWILLPRPCDWRWMRAGSRTPWYRQARLFRQPVPGGWDAVLDAVAAALRDGAQPVAGDDA
jgi:tetratricopeptide (TPR) repeat protein